MSKISLNEFVKHLSIITFYNDVEYTFFELFFLFQENFSFKNTAGGPLWKQGHADLLMLSLPSIQVKSFNRAQGNP